MRLDEAVKKKFDAVDLIVSAITKFVWDLDPDHGSSLVVDLDDGARLQFSYSPLGEARLAAADAAMHADPYLGPDGPANAKYESTPGWTAEKQELWHTSAGELRQYDAPAGSWRDRDPLL